MKLSLKTLSKNLSFFIFCAPLFATSLQSAGNDYPRIVSIYTGHEIFQLMQSPQVDNRLVARGYIMGIADAYQGMRMDDGKCILFGKEINQDHIFRAVLIYFRNNEYDLRLTARSGIHEALRELYVSNDCN